MAPKRGPKCKLPAPLPEGHVVKDLEGKEWKVGKKIAEGGFGLIYLAAPVGRPADDRSAVHVIKVEYHENGPLFSELKFYQRAAKPGNIKKWIGKKGLPYLGIPGYWGTGATEHNGKSYRFMVMDRLGSDLQKLILQRKLPKGHILQMGIRVLEVLEYMHENEYVHGDIKAANLMLGFRNPDEVYLADYGLSYRYCPDGTHKPYKDNPKKGHNGTIEFTSLDAHRGATPSRRGDLEILGYCLLQWLCGQLPWEQNRMDPAAVQAAKTKFLDELPNSVIKLASCESTTREVAEYLRSVYKLTYDEKPKYEMFKRILSDGLDSLGASSTGLRNMSAAGACSPVDFQQVDSHNPTPKPVKLRVQNKTCEKEAKATSGIKCREAPEYNPVFTSEIRCRNETSGIKQVVLQKASSKPVKQCFRKKTCEEDAKVTMNGNGVKCRDAQENRRLFVCDTCCKSETPRAKVYGNSESSYQCLRRASLESMHSEENTDGNRSGYMFINPQDCLFEGHNNPCILQPAISAKVKAQMVAIVVVLLITFLLLYSDNVQMLLLRHIFLP